MKHLSLCVLLAAAVGVSSRPAAPEENEHSRLNFDSRSVDLSTVGGIGPTGIDLSIFDETNLADLEDEYDDPPTETTTKLERSITRGFEESTVRSRNSDPRVTSLMTEWIHGLQTEDFANKEAIKAEKTERLAQIEKLAKYTTDQFGAARRERMTLYKNADRLRRTLHSQKVKHDEDLKLIGQNFAHMQQEIASLANTVSRLSQIQNEHPDTLRY